MTITAEAPPMPYRIIEESADRVIAVDENDVEICGAFKPAGHNTWTIYATMRMSAHHQHHVYACTAQAARWHVELLAELFTNNQGGQR